MEFEVVHEFDATIEEVAEALLDTGFQASLGDITALAGREVLLQEERGARIVRHTRCVLDIKIEGPAARFVSGGDPAWVEIAEWDPGMFTWDWHIEPEMAAELLEAGGLTELRPSKGGTIRRVTGKVRVKVPLYGGRVESLIIDGLEKAYDEEAERLARWLAS
jgi:hypothetical protein